MPVLRLRRTLPVGHHERVRPKRTPAWVSTLRMVYVLTLGSPSGARRNARCKVESDQVAVPSWAGFGARRASARMRSRAATS